MLHALGIITGFSSESMRNWTLGIADWRLPIADLGNTSGVVCKRCLLAATILEKSISIISITDGQG
jgi:hypothetical protein